MSIGLGGGAVVGLFAFWLYGVLPAPWDTLANTSALWAIVAVAATYLQRARGGVAIATGMLAMLGLVTGFLLIAASATSREWVMAIVVGTVAGALFGYAGAIIRSGGAAGRIAAATAVGGVIAGEGLYGIVVVDPVGPQWWFEIGCALLLVLLIGRGWWERTFALSFSAVAALVLVGAYFAYDAAATL